MTPLPQQNFEERIKGYTNGLHPVVPLDPGDVLLPMDFTAANKELTDELLQNTDAFAHYVTEKLRTAGARYGIGGYNEDRVIYRRSGLFGPRCPHPGLPQRGKAGMGAARSIHLGLDIWGPADTPVFAPLAGTVHSFAFNDAFGDYGATLILKHQLDDLVFHTLYGHLSLASIQNKKEGQVIVGGETIAWFGAPEENGHWPPHLHFQVIQNMQGNSGDYPGVCSYEDQSGYLENCPNPALLFPAAVIQGITKKRWGR